jgi:hypothetical protein
MFLLYHSEGCNICGGLFRKCYVNNLHTTTCSGMLLPQVVFLLSRAYKPNIKMHKKIHNIKTI